MKKSTDKKKFWNALAAAEVRKARSVIAEWMRCGNMSYKSAAMTIGKIAGHLDEAGRHCDYLNHYIGEEAK